MTTRAVAAVADALRHAAARRPDVLAPGVRLVVGYSGGQDSTCLLHALAQRGLDLVAAHVDHELRPESADQAGEVAAGEAAYHLPGGVELAIQPPRFVLRSHGRAQAPKRAKSWGKAPPRV